MKAKRFALYACLLLALLIFTHTAWAEADAPYAPPPMEETAIPLSDFTGEWPKLVTEEFAVIINPGPIVNPQGQSDIWFGNPEGNPCYLMLDIRLAESGLLLYRTGLIAPGEGMKQIVFVPEAMAELAQGAQKIELTIRTFELGSYVNLGDIALGIQLVYNP